MLVLVGGSLAVGFGLLSACSGVPRAWEQRFFTVQTNTPTSALARQALPPQAPVETYTFTPNANASTAATVAGNVAGMFGPWGELVSLAVGGFFGLYGMLRSSRSNKTAAVLAQVIETGRRILEQTPQGQQAQQQWVQWMMKHQAETGVLQNVIGILNKSVDPAQARSVANQLIALSKQP